ncbi:DUF4998 domain-containing protein [Sinomicrobium weinanense]|uniref:Discoidin domain-containing protein n=1 Tax=Sinomicrobium weinanense TaxID=2842200 RepID=A0A926JRV8_9FLAO|nr:DUF4998 domain-containing protein [Sinomicrobium weinanense]MBC9796367.1 discoidin domain-containing protein [Sinomicrobium weinanense]MBU3122632.1 discoidin domain-containing protein [Sinomicrobium weinanense]
MIPIKNILYKAWALILIIGLSYSCNSDIYDTYDDYVDQEEPVSVGKPDTIISRSGKERILFQVFINSDPKIKEGVIRWSAEDSTNFKVDRTTYQRDSLNVEVRIPEGNYDFEVYLKDSKGNKSIAVEHSATAYGENYRSNLVSRIVSTFSFDGARAMMAFVSGTENERNTEVKYTNTANEETVEVISRETDTIHLPGCDVEKDIMYRTYYVPTPAVEGVETALDEFGSDWKVLELPEILPIIENITFTDILGGVTADWNNPDGLDLRLDFAYTANGEEKTHTVESGEITGKTAISGMEAGEQEVRVTISDTEGNSFGPQTYVVAPGKAVKLDKSSWTVYDFSSEEPAEGTETYPDNGKAMAVIDDNPDTFWHSAWENGTPEYPHYVVIDMGAEKTIGSFEVFRRQGNDNGQTRHQFLVSSDGENWTDAGTFDMDPGTDEGQNYTIMSNPTARYFKYVAIEGPDHYAFLAEIHVYGLE